MALFGVRVVTDDGTDASGRRAVVRTLALPLSFLFLGLGFAGILLGDRRRALHDVIAGTAVIYSRDARVAVGAERAAGCVGEFCLPCGSAFRTEMGRVMPGAAMDSSSVTGWEEFGRSHLARTVPNLPQPG